jgi:hypothetical protein
MGDFNRIVSMDFAFLMIIFCQFCLRSAICKTLIRKNEILTFLRGQDFVSIMSVLALSSCAELDMIRRCLEVRGSRTRLTMMLSVDLVPRASSQLLRLARVLLARRALLLCNLLDFIC